MSKSTVTMYTTAWCGYCRRLKHQLDQAGIRSRQVDIERAEHLHHGDRIVARTGGFRTVPTVEIADELLVNPSLEEVRSALARLAG